jgi:hypothetical protein
LKSTLQLKLDAVEEAEREQIKARYPHPNLNLFERDRNSSPRPSFSEIGVLGDSVSTQVHQLLLIMAVDTEFLVHDRFEAWALDLASAALAMKALAWSYRYTTLGAIPEPEAIYCHAFDLLFYKAEAEHVLRNALEDALRMTGMDSASETLKILLRAREWYQLFLSNLGLTTSNVSAYADRCWDARPIIYKE